MIYLRKLLDLYQRMNFMSSIEKNKKTIVGRDYQIQKIHSFYNSVIDGETRTLIVKGEAGIGKTFMIERTFSNFKNATLVRGKQMQYGDNNFTVIKEVIDRILNNILVLPTSKYNEIIRKLSNELGNDLGYIHIYSDIAESIFGEQKNKIITDYNKSKYKIRKAIRTFIKYTSEVLFPLVIFFDDLQWTDPHTVDIIKFLIKDDTLNCLFIIAYRNNFDDRLKIEKYQTVIELQPLGENEISQILNEHTTSDIADINYLKRYIYSITLGNPFYINKVIETLIIEKIMEYKNKWVVHIDKLNGVTVPENISQIMMSRLMTLSKCERQFLDYLSCFDGTVTIAQLKPHLSIEDNKLQEIATSLCNQSFIIPLNIHEETIYHFAHDIIQEHIYNMIDHTVLHKMHYKIAKLSDNKSRSLTHFIRSDVNMWTDLEKDTYFHLLKLEGQKALEMSNYKKGVNIYEFCTAIINQSQLTYEEDTRIIVLLNLAKCYYYLGHYKEADQIFEDLMKNFSKNSQLIKIKRDYMKMLAFMGEDKRVVEIGVELLNLLNCHYDLDNMQEDIAIINSLYNDEFIENIVNKQDVKNQKTCDILDILYLMMPSAQIVSEVEFMYILVKIAVVSANGGYSKYSIIGYAASSFVFYNIIGDKQKGRRISDYILDNISSISDESIRIRISGFIATFLFHWSMPLNQIIEFLEYSMDLCYEIGDVMYLEYMSATLMFALFVQGEGLENINEKMNKRLSQIRELDIKEEHFAYHYIERNITSSIECLMSGILNENEQIDMSDNNLDNSTMFANLWFVLQRAYILGDIKMAYEITDRVKDKLDLARGHLIYIEVVFYFLIIRLEYHNQLEIIKKEENKKYIDEYIAFIGDVCSYYDYNHKVRLNIARGLYNSVFGDGIKTIGLYNEAILLAKERGNILLEAITNILASKHYVNHPKLLEFYKGEACECYKSWGAYVIAKNLEKNDTKEITLKASKNNKGNLISNINQLDEKEAFTYVLDSLVDNNKSVYAAVLFEKSGDMHIAYEKRSNSQALAYVDLVKISSRFNIQTKVISYSHRTSKVVIADETNNINLFLNDTWMKKHPNTSIVCVPLKLVNIVIGMFYLEIDNSKVKPDKIISLINSVGPILLTKCERIKDINLANITEKTNQNDVLTNREIDILKHVLNGMSNLDISKKEFISVGTVKSHLSNIYSKLEVDSRIKAVAKAKEINII